MGILISSRKNVTIPTEPMSLVSSYIHFSEHQTSGKNSHLLRAQILHNKNAANHASFNDPSLRGILSSVSDGAIATENNINADVGTRAKFDPSLPVVSKRLIRKADQFLLNDDILNGRRMSVKDNPGLLGRLMLLCGSSGPRDLISHCWADSQKSCERSISINPSLMDDRLLVSDKFTRTIVESTSEKLDPALVISSSSETGNEMSDVSYHSERDINYFNLLKAQMSESETSSESEHRRLSSTNRNQTENQASVSKNPLMPRRHTLEVANPSQRNRVLHGKNLSSQQSSESNNSYRSKDETTANTNYNRTGGEILVSNIPRLTRNYPFLIDNLNKTKSSSEHQTRDGNNPTISGHEASISADPIRARDQILIKNIPFLAKYYTSSMNNATSTRGSISESDNNHPSECRTSVNIGLHRAGYQSQNNSIPCLTRRTTLETDCPTRTVGLMFKSADLTRPLSATSVSKHLHVPRSQTLVIYNPTQTEHSLSNNDNAGPSECQAMARDDPSRTYQPLVSYITPFLRRRTSATDNSFQTVGLTSRNDNLHLSRHQASVNNPSHVRGNILDNYNLMEHRTLHNKNPNHTKNRSSSSDKRIPIFVVDTPSETESEIFLQNMYSQLATDEILADDNSTQTEGLSTSDDHSPLGYQVLTDDHNEAMSLSARSINTEQTGDLTSKSINPNPTDDLTSTKGNPIQTASISSNLFLSPGFPIARANLEDQIGSNGKFSSKHNIILSNNSQQTNHQMLPRHGLLISDDHHLSRSFISSSNDSNEPTGAKLLNNNQNFQTALQSSVSLTDLPSSDEIYDQMRDLIPTRATTSYHEIIY
ncbi:uncharacterized protein [Scyliorhinus torazame]|uniref:uncharacterized protein n=1 Tax=Scyliorhinus torazame TaxID=75743 RepID=UPI003B5B8C93